MAQVTVETVSYPAWWAGATTVDVALTDATLSGVSRSDVELLPEGVSQISTGYLFPWWRVKGITKAS